MIKSVTVTNPRKESLHLVLESPNDSEGIEVWDIKGLGPVKTSINNTQYAVSDGSHFNSSRTAERNIVFELGMREDPDIETVRHRIYRYFPVKGSIEIDVHTDHGSRTTYGIVESNEIEIFSSQEGASVSVICNSPYFVNTELSVLNFSAEMPNLQFPVSNEHLTNKLIQVGIITKLPNLGVYYPSQIDCGITFDINIYGDVTNLTLYNTVSNESILLNTSRLSAYGLGTKFISGDTIRVSTHTGYKYVQLTRNGVTQNILNVRERGSKWPHLYYGDNVLAVTAVTGANVIDVFASYRTLYEGV